MPAEQVYLGDFLRRLEDHGKELHSLAREVTEVKTSVNAWHVEMRGTVHSSFDHFKEVTSKTEEKVRDLEKLITVIAGQVTDVTSQVSEATVLINLAVKSKSKTEATVDHIVLTAGTFGTILLITFGAPYFTAKEDFWNTVWIAIKSAVKLKAGG
jgi:trimethylamine:corrinoid methyltransferase-like protein